MTISSISSGSGPSAAQLYRLASTTASQTDTSSSGTTTQTSSSGSRFASAISDAFASLGISLDSTTSPSSTASSGTADTASSDPSDSAVGAFVQSLFAALHGQSAGNTQAPLPPGDGADATTAAATTPVASTDATGQAQGTGKAHHGHGGHGHGGGKIESDLQSLIQELSASSTSSTDTSATATSATASTSTYSTLATLEKSYDALVSQSGGSTATTGTDSLTSFLKALASGLHGAPATGNVVTTQA